MAHTPLIVSVSGIRGIVGESLTAEIVRRFARALGLYFSKGRVVISRDSRPSGMMLEHAVADGLQSAGCAAIALGILPTPTCGLAIRELNAVGGIQISASHNSAPYNGLKLFGPRGMVLTAAEGGKVLDIYNQLWTDDSPISERTLPTTSADLLEIHLQKVIRLIDTDLIKQRGFHVFINANHGAGGPLAVRLAKALGCRITPFGCEPDGHFEHEPEPTEANLRSISPLVAEHHCDIGIALDPDSDRLALIDEKGRYIGEELTLALATECRLRQTHGPVVVNMSTSRVIEDIAKRHGCEFHRSAVGEANVAEKMMETHAVIGGEGNGGVIDPRVGFVRDPFIGLGLILHLLAETRKTLSQLTADLPMYHIVKSKWDMPKEALPKAYECLQAHWPDVKVNRLDGLRMDWPDRWLHLRPSNTEPIVRIIAEGPTEADATSLCQEASDCLSEPEA